MDILDNPFAVIEQRFNRIEKLVLKVLEHQAVAPLSSTQDKPFLTIDEVSELIHMPKQTIYSKSAKHEIPCMRRGRKLLFDREELLRWVKEARKETTAETEEKINQKILGRGKK